MATPKQIAYLQYLGLKKVDRLTDEAAKRRIEILHKKANGFCGRRLRSKIWKWNHDRLILHPDLYRNELLEYILSDDSRFRAFVRSRHVKCSGTLSAAKIEKVISHLLDEKPGWWNKPNDTAIFYMGLTQLFPDCVDGPPPQRTPKSSQAGSKGGCLGVVAACAFVAFALKLLLSFTSDS